jgi:hypothetical protein
MPRWFYLPEGQCHRDGLQYPYLRLVERFSTHEHHFESFKKPVGQVD